MQDGEPGVGGVGDDPVGQDVPVAESNPGYLLPGPPVSQLSFPLFKSCFSVKETKFFRLSFVFVCLVPLERLLPGKR